MQDFNFESAMTRLEKIVEEMERDDQTLEESLKLFEEGTRLAAFCSETLQKAEQKMTTFTREEIDSPQTEEAAPRDD